MQDQWTRITDRLTSLGCLQAMALRPGASPEELEHLEEHIGFQLPAPFKSFLLIHDGQDGFGLMQGTQFLSVAGIREQWDVWRSLDETEMNADCADSMSSEPAGFVKPLYCNPAWIPVSHDGGGNHTGFDFDPDALGTAGQVIAFGRDEDVKHLLAESFELYIESCIAWLNSAVWNGEYLDRAPSA